MGYHIINITEGKIEHTYVESYERLCYVDTITDDSIIYPREEHWKPFKVAGHENYKNLF
ncbi:hypothetical protein GNY06_04050 [Elizabethkingia argentiflava]|uniref:Uncharacterized protein n=1 Tax=Elizabethkingia argenteiflava TaxID=2681556 RepID=A0A845PWW5_9FLAO|nr:hypothetical protein [Elizabethkingia argenteiflava]NAW50590.1 hypothetical protein [Elizabethkingia argenteiflava]